MTLDASLHYQIRQLSRFTAIFAAVISIAGCFTKPIDPVAPKWDVGITAPITVKTYTIEDVVKKDTSMLRVGGGSQVLYHTVARATPTTAGAIFSLSPIITNTRAKLGSLSIGVIAPIVLPLTIPGATTGQPLPAVSRLSLPPASITFTQFQRITVKSGTVTLTLRNNLPIPVVVDSTITLRDSAGAVIVAMPFSPNQIPANGQISSNADLAGKIIPAKVTAANFSISEGGLPSTPAGNLLVATVSSSEIIATEAVLSSIPPQVLLDNSSFSLPVRDSSHVREVGIQNGTLTLNLQSSIGMNMFFKARFPQLLTGSGQAFVDSFFLGARAALQRQITLSGLRLRSTTSGFINQIDVVTTANLYEGSRGLPVTVRESDSVQVRVASSTIAVDTVVGVIKPTVITLNQRIPLRLGDFASKFRGQLVIPAANLSVIPQTSITFPMQLNLVLKAKDASGRDVVLPVPVSKFSGTLSPIVFAPVDVGTFLTQISGKLPDTLQLVGSVLLNPDYDTVTVGSAGSRSTVGGAVDFSVPLTVSIVGGSFADTVAFGDTAGTGNSTYQENADLFNGINSGTIHCDLDNGIPMGVSFTMILLDKDSKALLVLPQTSGDSFIVSPASVSGGEVARTVKSSRLIALTGPEVRLFERAKYVQYAISIATPGTQPVTFRSYDGLNLRVWGEFSYRVNK